MAVDGIFLNIISDELQNLVGSRVDRVFQISRFEVILVVRKARDRFNVLISANSSSARINFTGDDFKAPKTPPMFCMILRKYLIGSRLSSVEQVGLDRVLFLNFCGRNEIGDLKNLVLAVELIGKQSNLILFDKETEIIVDAIKRIDEEISKVRIIQPKEKYKATYVQTKLNLFECNLNDLVFRIFSHTNLVLSSAILKSLQGVSPVVARELSYSFSDKIVADFTESEKEDFVKTLQNFISLIKQKKFDFVVFFDKGKPKDFCWFNLKQFDGLFEKEHFENASEMLEFFYVEKVEIERINQSCYNVVKRINYEIKKIENKKEVRLKELSEAENFDHYKKYAELVCANMYKIKRGDKAVEVVDFYNNDEKLTIKLNVDKTPSQNVEQFYKLYKKSRNARQKLKDLILDCDYEIEFLKSELDVVFRAKSEGDVLSVVFDLNKRGLFKKKQSNTILKRNHARDFKTNFLRFKSTDGFEICCGRNNQQNDYLTLKKAQKTDLWLHVRDYAGSHVIILTKGQTVPDQTIKEAAIVAAVNSSLCGSSNVEVDYALVKNVTKPNGGRPGMVIFKNNRTVYVDPDEELVESLKIN